MSILPPEIEIGEEKQGPLERRVRVTRGMILNESSLNVKLTQCISVMSLEVVVA